MATYRTYKVDIVIEEGSTLDKRLQKYAKGQLTSAANAVSTAVSWGVYHHMSRNLDLMERGAKTASSRTPEPSG